MQQNESEENSLISTKGIAKVPAFATNPFLNKKKQPSNLSPQLFQPETDSQVLSMIKAIGEPKGLNAEKAIPKTTVKKKNGNSSNELVESPNLKKNDEYSINKLSMMQKFKLIPVVKKFIRILRSKTSFRKSNSFYHNRKIHLMDDPVQIITSASEPSILSAIKSLCGYIKQTILVNSPKAKPFVIWSLLLSILTYFVILQLPFIYAFEVKMDRIQAVIILFLYFLEIAIALNTAVPRNGILTQNRKKIFFQYACKGLFFDAAGIATILITFYDNWSRKYERIQIAFLFLFKLRTLKRQITIIKEAITWKKIWFNHTVLLILLLMVFGICHGLACIQRSICKAGICSINLSELKSISLEMEQFFFLSLAAKSLLAQNSIQMSFPYENIFLVLSFFIGIFILFYIFLKINQVWKKYLSDDYKIW